MLDIRASNYCHTCPKCGGRADCVHVLARNARLAKAVRNLNIRQIRRELDELEERSGGLGKVLEQQAERGE